MPTLCDGIGIAKGSEERFVESLQYFPRLAVGRSGLVVGICRNQGRESTGALPVCLVQEGCVVESIFVNTTQIRQFYLIPDIVKYRVVCQEIRTLEMAPITTKIMIAAIIIVTVYPMDFSSGDFMRTGNPT